MRISFWRKRKANDQLWEFWLDLTRWFCPDLQPWFWLGSRALVPATVDDLFKNLENSSYDLLVIDGTPRASKGTLAASKISDLVVLPWCASRADLVPTLKLGFELVNQGISRKKIVFALSRVATKSEIDDARDYIHEAGFRVLDGCVFEQPGYRQAQNDGYSLTETRFKSLNDKANIVMESILKNLMSE